MTDLDVVAWHKMSDAKPEPGTKFLALYDDGSGAWLGFAHDHGVIDSDGDDHAKMPNAGWWAYLPSGFRLSCEDHPCAEFEVQLPDHAPPRLDISAARERDAMRRGVDALQTLLTETKINCDGSEEQVAFASGVIEAYDVFRRQALNQEQPA